MNVGDDGLPFWDSDTWCGLAIHSSKVDAEAMFNAPEDYLPFLSTAVEQWHALAIPVTHGGSLNWNGKVETNSAIRTADEDPKGPLSKRAVDGINYRRIYLARRGDYRPHPSFHARRRRCHRLFWPARRKCTTRRFQWRF